MRLVLSLLVSLGVLVGCGHEADSPNAGNVGADDGVASGAWVTFGKLVAKDADGTMIGVVVGRLEPTSSSIQVFDHVSKFYFTVNIFTGFVVGHGNDDDDQGFLEQHYTSEDCTTTSSSYARQGDLRRQMNGCKDYARGKNPWAHDLWVEGGHPDGETQGTSVLATSGAFFNKSYYYLEYNSDTDAYDTCTPSTMCTLNTAEVDFPTAFKSPISISPGTE